MIGLVVLLTTVFASLGRAAELRCATIAGGTSALGEIEAERRISFVRRTLRNGARRARIWTWSWVGLFSAVATVNLAMVASDNGSARSRDYLGAGAAGVGLLFMALAPPRVLADQRRFEKRLSLGEEDLCAALADGEAVLLRDVRSTEFGRGPLVVIGNVFFNAGLGVTSGFLTGEWNQAAAVSLVGALVGTLQALTLPGDLVEALDRYRRGDLGTPAPPRSWGLLPSIGLQSVGLTLTGTY